VLATVLVVIESTLDELFEFQRCVFGHGDLEPLA
jgi:hypothetical protein